MAKGDMGSAAGSALASGPSRMFRPTGIANYMMPQQTFSNGQIINQSGQSSPIGNQSMPQSPMMPSQDVWASILQKMMGNSGFTGLAQPNPPQSMYGLFGNGMIK